MIGSRVYIVPAKSMKFAGMWGTILDVDNSSTLPLLVEFNPGGGAYLFSYDEAVDENTYQEIISVPVGCMSCGSDITGQFVGICEQCEDERFKEDMTQWQK